MQDQYNPSEIEPKWQKAWEKKPLYQALDFAKKKKFYALVEFPYPSGEGLHIGHAFCHTIIDIFARRKRMAGFNVLCPMGWDAFGLPTENYAIKTGTQPALATKANTDNFRRQAKQLGMSFDWSREVDTTDPNYYKWTQWIFLQFFKHGLAYKAETPVGWCPSCKIILANEEIVGGKCERCGAGAEYRRQSQWLLRITKYADRLLKDLDLVDYPSYVKKSQADWIGRTEGINIDYPVIGSKLSVICYSTRPETNFGATFIVIAPEHPLVAKLTTSANQKSVSEYITMAKKTSEMERVNLEREKTGVFTGSYALNRLANKKLPIYVSDFVVLTAGTGIVVGVPAHDERDFAFGRHHGLEITPVLKPANGTWDFSKGPFTDIDNAVVFNSDFLNGLPAKEAIAKVSDYLVKKGWGKRAVNYHLRDWVFSRQHYWGEPIPMIHCPKCGIVPVPEKDLPVELPKVEKYQPTQTGESPLAKIREWVEVACPDCGGPARRETDTMPNWAGSNWYFMRYCDPKNNRQLADPKKLKYWLPVDVYLGGAEHTTLHLLYSRFVYKFLFDIGVAPTSEPYASRRQHGVILGEDGFRMSKSRGNVINPEEMVKAFGADTLRIYLMFMGPYDSTMPWQITGVEGCGRFLKRVWRLTLNKAAAKQTSAPLAAVLNKTIKKVGADIDELKFNTAIAAMMEFINAWQNDKSGLSKTDAEKFLLILAPFAPFMTEELYSRLFPSRYSLAANFFIHQQAWPKAGETAAATETTIVVQVNGRMRGQIQTATRNAQSAIEKLARKESGVAKYLAGHKISKTIFIPGRLINFVTD